ncbi:MAG: hypothetical protein ACLP19_25800, partial [Xanthobacteraceae bacterium]
MDLLALASRPFGAGELDCADGPNQPKDQISRKTRTAFRHDPSPALGNWTYAALTVIFFSAFCASALLGKITLR